MRVRDRKARWLMSGMVETEVSRPPEGRSARRRGRGPGWTVRTVVAVAAVVAIGAAVTACGSSSPTAAGHNTPTTKPGSQASAPTTSGSHPTPTKLLPTLERAIKEQNDRQYAEAVADFLTVVKADPSNQIAWYDLGVIAGIHSETAQAIRDYQAAVTGDPAYVPALYNLAVLEASAHPKTAMSLYRRVLKLEPNNANAHLNLAFALETSGQTTPAMTQFAEALKLDPDLASRVPSAEGGTA